MTADTQLREATHASALSLLLCPDVGRDNASGTAFDSLRIMVPIRNVSDAVKRADVPQVIGAYREQYGVSLYQRPGRTLKLHYWERLTGLYKDSGHQRRISLKTGGFVRRRGCEDEPARGFMRVVRIVTITIGT